MFIYFSVACLLLLFSAMAQNIEITVISDFACPWCHVGNARLKQAVQQYKSEDAEAMIDYNFVPYMIDPETKEEGEDYLEYNIRRWGGDGWVSGMRRNAARDGVHYSNWVTWPHTLKAHRLMLLGGKMGKAEVLKDLMFDAIYEKGKNVSKVDDLLHVAVQSGISKEVAYNYLRSDEGIEEVIDRDRFAKRELKVSGVPCFMIRSVSNPQKRTQVLRGAVGADQLYSALLQVGS